MAKKQKKKIYPNVRVSPETKTMLEYLKKERKGSIDCVIQDMLSEFASNIFDCIMDEHDPGVEIEDFGTPKYYAWREVFLSRAAKNAYADFKKREWRRFEDNEISSHPRMATVTRVTDQKSQKLIF